LRTTFASKGNAAYIRGNPPRYEFRDREVIEMRISHFEDIRKALVRMRREEKAMIRGIT
jgi:hypothetical protein